MNILCITGPSRSHIESIEEILNAAGMAKPRPSSRVEVSNLAIWHQKVLESPRSKGTLSVDALPQPGRLWQLVASELLLANLDNSFWGWSSTESLWLLDFWLETEPDLSAILVAVSPQRWLADQATSAESAKPDQLLKDWQLQHQLLLRMHLRHPQRSLLADIDDVLAHPQAFASQCQERWQLPLAEQVDQLPAHKDLDPLARYLADRICAEATEVLSLQREIDASRTTLDTTQNKSNAVTLDAALKQHQVQLQQLSEIPPLRQTLQTREQALEELQQENALALQQLQQAQEGLEQLFAKEQALEQKTVQLTEERNAQAQQLAERDKQLGSVLNNSRELEQQVTTLTQEHSAQAKQLAEREQVLTQVTQERDTKTKQLAEREGKIKTLTQERDTQTQQLAERAKALESALNKSRELDQVRSELKESQEEGELLLQQLHQVQEELESIFLKNQDLEQKVRSLTQEREAQAKQLAERQQMVAKLSQEREVQGKQLAQQQQTLAKLTQESEAQAKHLADRQKTVINLTQERDIKAKQLAERQQAVAKLSQEREAQGKQLADLNSELDMVKSESEIHLIQLKRVHEELDKVFHQKQKLESQQKDFEDRKKLLLSQLDGTQIKLTKAQSQNKQQTECWLSLQKIKPDLFLYESLNIKTANVPFADGASEISIGGIVTAMRNISRISLLVLNKLDPPCLAIYRDESAPALIQWPEEEITDDGYLVLNLEQPSGVTKELGGLDNLTSTDWFTLYGLVQTLRSLDAHDSHHKVSFEPSCSLTASELNHFAEDAHRVLAEWSRILRYDRMELVAVNSHQNYEHIWIRLINVSYANHVWASFEFRFACAGDLHQTFAKHPRLEFPAGAGEVAFDNWFAESKNMYGENLELRYSPPNQMDIKVWRKLSDKDQGFITEIVKNLPGMITDLKIDQGSVSRPLQHWIDLAKKVERTHVNLMTASQLPKVLKKRDSNPELQKYEPHNLANKSLGQFGLI